MGYVEGGGQHCLRCYNGLCDFGDILFSQSGRLSLQAHGLCRLCQEPLENGEYKSGDAHLECLLKQEEQEV